MYFDGRAEGESARVGSYPGEHMIATGQFSTTFPCSRVDGSAMCVRLADRGLHLTDVGRAYPSQLVYDGNRRLVRVQAIIIAERTRTVPALQPPMGFPNNRRHGHTLGLGRLSGRRQRPRRQQAFHHREPLGAPELLAIDEKSRDAENAAADRGSDGCF